MTRARLAASLLMLAALAGWAGCTERAPEQPCTCAEAPPPVDAPLMAFLSKARAAHHQADEREEAQDVAGAITALEQITATSLGATGSRPEAREVLSDTRARLVDLRSQVGKYDEAELDVVEGLKLAPTDSYFEGHLHEMRGVSEERRAKTLAESGDKAGSEAARRRAFESFEKAIDVQDRVIRKELGDAGGEKR
jgi:hypothetical protein